MKESKTMDVSGMATFSLTDLSRFENDTLWLHKNIEKLRNEIKDEFVAVKNKEIIARNKNINKIISQLKQKNISPELVVIEFVHEKGIELIL